MADMKTNKRLLLAIGICCVVSSYSQPKKIILTANAVMELVRNNHPVAKQAMLLVEAANAARLSARGGFDPLLDIDASRKTFDGKNYYYYTNPEIQIPTAAALTIKSGLENNGGDYLSSEISKGKTSYLGIELPLGTGLLIDKRRAALQQAKIFSSQSEQDRLKIMNDLLLEAYTDYWEWAGAYQLYQVYSGFVDNATKRLQLTRNAWQNGDRALMDTLESFTQLQQYQLLQSEALLKLNNAALELSNFLWMPNDTPFQIPEGSLPDTVQFAADITLSSLEQLLAQSALQNPELKSAGYKVNSLEVEKRLKFQGMLPYFSVKANILSKDYGLINSWDGAYFQQNYKWGVSFSMPLLLRQGRGDYQKARLKLKEAQLALAGKQWQTENKIRNYFNENTQLMQQLSITQGMQQRYRQLLRNEEFKWQQGESSLFLVNSREMKLLELLQKQVALKVKYLTTSYKLNWAAGLLK